MSTTALTALSATSTSLMTSEGEGTGTAATTTAATTTDASSLTRCAADFEVTGADKSDCTNRVGGETCTVSCVGAYEGNPATYYCNPEEGRFEGTGPSCQKKRCRASSLPSGLGLDASACGGALAGESCVVGCLQDYNGTGTLFECRNDGLFHGTAPTCLPATCDLPTWLSDASVEHTCDSPSRVRRNDACVASCATGYTGEPQDLTCGSRMLQGAAPSCAAAACSRGWPGGEGVDASDCDGKTTTQTCSPRCSSGFSTEVASNTVTCSATGAFSSSSLVCTRSTCAALSTLSGFSDALLQNSCAGQDKFGDNCAVLCATGYTLVGSTKSFRCAATPGAADSSSVQYMEVAADGSLVSASPPTCEGNTCTVGKPNRLGVIHDCDGKTTGQTCTATPATGYTGGSFTFTCTSTGAFTGPEISVTLLSLQCTANFGAHVKSLCLSNGKIGDTCWTYCEHGYIGQAAQVRCEYDPSNDPQPQFVPVSGASTTCTARRLKAASAWAAAPLPAGRRLAGECGQAAVNAASIDQPGIASDCLDRANGRSCIVACAAGYEISGAAVVKSCLSGVLQNPGLPSCIPVTCIMNLPDALGVTHDCTGKVFGESCTATCSASGYSYASGATASTFQCEASGEFLGTNPSCERVSCGPPALSPEHRSELCDRPLRFGDACAVDCAPGYSLEGAPEVYTCAGDGTLHGTPPVCRPNVCSGGLPMDGDLQTDACQSVATGGNCRVSCANGYSGGTSTYNCLASGMLNGTRPTCTRQICPNTVSVATGLTADCSSVAFGETCTATCREGYALTSGSSSSFTCAWDAANSALVLQGSSVPECTPLPCEQGLMVDSWKVGHSCSGTVTDTPCTAYCLPGYLGTTTTLTCAGNRSFTGTLPSCAPAPCGGLPALAHAEHGCEGVAFGSSCFVGCRRGYRPHAPGAGAYGWTAEWRCGLDAGSTQESWAVSLRGEDPLCRPVECLHNAPAGPFFSHNCSGARTGEHCVVSCVDSYQGDASILTCGADGAYHGTLPECPFMTTTRSIDTLTTTTSALEMRAVFARSFSEVLLLFTDSVVLCEAKPCLPGPLNVPCGDVIHSSSLAMLGNAPHCLWSHDRTALRVRLGAGAAAAPGDRVYTVSGVLSRNGMSVVPSIDAILERGSDSAAVVAVLDAEPLQTPTCGQVMLSSAGSSGGYGRALRYDWRLGPSTPAEAQVLLRSALDDAGASLQLTAQQMFAAYQAVPSAARPLFLEVSVGVSNWLGEVANATTRVTVLKTTPSWQVVRTTAAEVSFANFEESTFAVRLLPPQSCVGEAQAPALAPAVAWTFRRDASAGWTGLAAAGLADASSSPIEVRFPAFSFAPGSQHELQVEVAGGNSLGFGFTVSPRPPPSASILGPRQASSRCGFLLDASGSSDPSHDPAAGPAALAYAWRCAAEAGGDCGSVAAAAGGPTLEVAAGILPPGTYIFTVLVTSGQGATALTGNASVSVALSPGALPPIVVTSTWKNMQRISLDSSQLHVTAAMDGLGGACLAPGNLTWQWFLADVEAGAFLESLSPRSNVLEPVTAFPAASLQGEGTYAFALVGASTLAALDSVLQVSSTLVNVEALGMSLALSAAFIADEPPLPGVVYMSPRHGEAVATRVSITTQGWIDSSPGGLEYAFYHSRVPDGAMTLVNGTPTCSSASACRAPQIDWTDRTSPNYWTRQGLRLLRGWQPGAEVAGSLPAGGHRVYVRARDALGGTRSTTALGPLITSMPTGITEVAAQQALASAALDAPALLDAAHALATGEARAGEEGAVRQLALGALQSAAAAGGAGADAVQRFARSADAVALALGSDNLQPSAVDLASLATSLDSVVSQGQFTPGAYSAEDAAEGVLRVLKSSGQIYERTSRAGSEDEVYESKVASIAASLTDKLASEVQAGQALSLSSGASLGGQAVNLDLHKELRSSVAGGKSYFSGKVVLPANPIAGRRLTSSCNEVIVTRMDWLGLNFQQRATGTHVVNSNTSVAYVKVSGCGAPLALSTHAEILLDIDARPSASAEPVCVRFDNRTVEWSTRGVSVLGAAGPSSVSLRCLSSHSAGFYAVGFEVSTATTTGAVAATSTLSAMNTGPPTPRTPTPLGRESGVTEASSQGVLIGIGVSSALFFLVIGFVALHTFFRLKGKDSMRKKFEEGLEYGIDEHEHEGIGELPKSAINIALPSGEDDDDMYEEDNPDDDSLEGSFDGPCGYGPGFSPGSYGSNSKNRV